MLSASDTFTLATGYSLPAGGYFSGRTQTDPTGGGVTIAEIIVPGSGTVWYPLDSSSPSLTSAAGPDVMTPYGPITPIVKFATDFYPGAVASSSQAAQVSSNAQATEAGRLTQALPPIGPYLGPQAMDPIWLRSDCNCRGGQFVDVPGQPQNSYCLPPSTPTGKMFDVASRGCVPIKGFKPPIVPFSQNCYWKNHNLCLYGGIALGVLLIAWLATSRRSGPAKSPEVKVDTGVPK